MNGISVFDVLGPIMIGPSSSHTAGAVRLAKTARDICEGDFDGAVFTLYGSFSGTYKGHGTDKALVAGVLGMMPDDERIERSFEEAEKMGIKYSFENGGLYENAYHENTVRIDFFLGTWLKMSVTGSSTGGGAIMITQLNGFDVRISGDYPTLILIHRDEKGVISNVSDILAENKINIARMSVNRTEKGGAASTVIETDDVIGEKPAREIKALKSIRNIAILSPAFDPARG